MSQSGATGAVQEAEKYRNEDGASSPSSSSHLRRLSIQRVTCSKPFVSVLALRGETLILDACTHGVVMASLGSAFNAEGADGDGREIKVCLRPWRRHPSSTLYVPSE